MKKSDIQYILQPYQEKIDIFHEQELLAQETVSECKLEGESLKNNEKQQLMALPYMKLAMIQTELASYYFTYYTIEKIFLHVKNSNILTTTRKCVYNAIISLIGSVTDCIDVPFSEYSSATEVVDVNFSVQERLELVQMLGLLCSMLNDEFGANSRWKWVFVDLEMKLCVGAKNMLNLKTVIQYIDPQHAQYRSTMAYLDLLKKILHTSAKQMRIKYEIFSNQRFDFIQAVSLLESLRSIYVILNENSEVEELKKQINVWNAKLQSDEKSKK